VTYKEFQKSMSARRQGHADVLGSTGKKSKNLAEKTKVAERKQQAAQTMPTLSAQKNEPQTTRAAEAALAPSDHGFTLTD
jgi:hypothetical protein